MSKAWLEAVRQIDGIAIVGLVDLDAARARARAREFELDGVAIGTSLDAVLDQTRPDVVFDVVVPAARRDVAMSAFAHDCHLLTEKPLADSSDNARAIIDAARRAGRIHAVVQNRRYLADVRRIRRFLDSGAIGAATSIHADFFIAPHFGGFREEMRHVLLLDMAIHTFDAARYMVNGEPASVYCQEWEPPNSWYRQGSSATAIFELGGGKMFTYRGSWCADGLRTSWESAWRIVGERGTLTWDGYRRIAGRSRRAGARGPARPGRAARRAAARSARPGRRPSRRDPGFRRRRRDRRASRRRAEATISRAWPWSSARSKAPKPAAASKIAAWEG